jgi:hypothetical protein
LFRFGLVCIDLAKTSEHKKKPPRLSRAFVKLWPLYSGLERKPTCHADVVVDERDKRGFGA